MVELKTSLENRVKLNKKKIQDTEASNGRADQAQISKLQNTYKQYSSLSAEYKVRYDNLQNQLAVAHEKLNNLEGSTE